MTLKVVVLAIIAPLLFGAGLIFDAASRTAFALEMAEDAHAAPSNAIRAEILTRAERDLGSGLELAAFWHAGAAEARSGLAQMRAAAENNPEPLSRSTKWAARAVALAPVQPNAWARLAMLTDEGEAIPACRDARECIERSWRTGPMAGGDTGCARLKFAHQHGWLEPKDPRIDQYALSGAGAVEIARCLEFLGPDVVFQALMRRAR